MNRLFGFIFKLTLWLLLTADTGPTNVIIGIALAALLPHQRVRSSDASRPRSDSLREWLSVGRKLIIAIPTAYIEAVEMIFRPHSHETVGPIRSKPRRPPALVFLDVFLITYTPKTIVIRHDENNFYEVHYVEPPRQNRRSKQEQL
ncbi:Na+/H+ antiporter subunit E [Synechococcus sp. PCC 7335]|uniref:Na+/H+ antiporter subunit E n=1 Tax=Synechococcus sp. (strain ATCC 29403 / PCC 7335) TaxID=91464 RepID=UPI00057158B2|nr:Na+/H+ antiporter subunit E [Synechococcus sp. PCC 7335]